MLQTKIMVVSPPHHHHELRLAPPLACTNYELQATSYEPQATSYQPRATSYELQALWRAASLTVLCGVDGGRATVGAFSFSVEGFDLHVELGVGRDGCILEGVVPLLRVGHNHLPPLGAVARLEGDDVAKVLTIVVLPFHGLNRGTGEWVRTR